MNSEKQQINNVLKIGVLSVLTYFAGYYIRSILSVITPQLLLTGEYTKEYIGLLSSLFFLFYAIGQLINGFIGDIIKPKYMLLTGMSIAGIVQIIFPLASIGALQIICFSLFGFGLSMMRGPLVKTISENMDLKYSRLFCMGLSISTFLGPLATSVLALIFEWKMLFFVAGVITLLVAVLCFLILTRFEKKGYIRQNELKQSKKFALFDVFKLKNFLFFMSIAAITEICNTSIAFWIPTYLTEHLKINASASTLIFSAMSLLKAVCPFLCLAILRLFKNNDVKMVRTLYVPAGLLFVVMFFVKIPFINILAFLVAIMLTSIIGSDMWSSYIPSLGKTGMVSTANGVLDFTGYAFTSLSNIIFASLMTSLGWNAVILTWASLMLLGFTFTLFVKNSKSE